MAKKWEIDSSDRDRTVWTREGTAVMVETYKVAATGVEDGFSGFTISHVADGSPAGVTGDYQRFGTLEEALFAAEMLDAVTNTGVESVVEALEYFATVHVDSDDAAHISGYAPDSSAYDGNTEPGGPWDRECDDRLADIREALPPGWSADWLDDDVAIRRKATMNR